MFGGKPLALLELALDGEIELAISEAILTETLRVLRDKFHRTPEQLQEAEDLLTAVTRHVASVVAHLGLAGCQLANSIASVRQLTL